MKYYLLIFILALFPRLFLFHTPYWTTPDALEYLSVTKNLAEGKGFTSTVKIHTFDHLPITRSALGTKPPLFSLFLFPFYKISTNAYFLQLAILTTGAIAVVMFFHLASILMNRRFAFLAATLFALNPDFLINNRLLLVEPLFLCLVFSSLILLFQKKSLFLIALLASLAYLTRVEGLLLFPVVCFYLWLDRGFKITIRFVLLSFVCLLPYFYLNNQINGSPLANVGNFHFVTLDFMHSAFYDYGQPVLAPLTFIRIHFLAVIHKSFTLFSQLVVSLLKPSNLGLLFLIPWWLSLKKLKQFSIFLFIPLNLLIISATFGLVLDAPRYLIFIDACVILLAIFHYSRHFNKLNSFLIFFVFAIYLIFDFHRLAWARQETDPNWNNEKLLQVSSLIKDFPQNTFVASENPALVDIKTDHPSIILPKNLSQSLFQMFVDEYHPGLFLTTDISTLTFQTLKTSGLTEVIFSPYHLFIVESKH